ncbi:MAG: GspE/PulE family protein, partial [Polaribacter sp.]
MEETQFDIATEIAQLISSEQAYSYRIIPVEKNMDTLTFKTDSENLNALSQELSIVLGKTIILRKETLENIQNYLEKNYRKRH